jgi:hypothetical protein
MRRRLPLHVILPHLRSHKMQPGWLSDKGGSTVCDAMRCDAHAMLCQAATVYLLLLRIAFISL